MTHLDIEVLCFTLTEYVCIAFMTNLDIEVDVYLEWVCRYLHLYLSRMSMSIFAFVFISNEYVAFIVNELIWTLKLIEQK